MINYVCILHSNCNFVLSISCILALTLLFVNCYRVTTLLKTLRHIYNHNLYHVVFIDILTIYIMKLCYCSPNYMYIHVRIIFWLYGLSRFVLSCILSFNTKHKDINIKNVLLVSFLNDVNVLKTQHCSFFPAQLFRLAFDCQFTV